MNGYKGVELFLSPKSLLRPYEGTPDYDSAYDLMDMALRYSPQSAHGTCPRTGVALFVRQVLVMGRVFYRVFASGYAYDGSDLADFLSLHGFAGHEHKTACSTA